jgi:LPXTG-motif cell wall-anchored protein
VAVSVAYQPEPSDGDSTTGYVVAIIAVLVIAGSAGFVWYRRRAP